MQSRPNATIITWYGYDLRVFDEEVGRDGNIESRAG